MKNNKLWILFFVAAFIASISLSVKLVFADTELAKKPDYSSAKNLAISVSYPIYGNAKNRDPRSRVAGGAGDQKSPGNKFVSAAQVAAHKRATQIGTNTSRPTLTPSKRLALNTSTWANCSSHTGILVINTIDKNFPGFSARIQRNYMSNPANGWKKISTLLDESRYTPDKYMPGDIFVTNKDTVKADGKISNHTFMWVGEHKGQTEIVSEASHAPVGKTGGLPSLHKNRIKKPDSKGRVYDVYRYVGKNSNSTNATVLRLQSRSGTATVTASSGINIRTNPTTSSKKVGLARKNMKIKYDGYVNNGGYRWLSFKQDGKRYYFSQGPAGTMKWVTGGVK